MVALRSSPRHAASIAMALLCAFTVAFLASRDLFLPEVRDREIWFGFEIRGAAALWTAPLHWALFGAAGWAFWKNMRWIWPAAVYPHTPLTSGGFATCATARCLRQRWLWIRCFCMALLLQ